MVRPYQHRKVSWKKSLNCSEPIIIVLPSSIHELLILPDNGSMQLSELEAMVREVNATQVAPEDRLSDKVQYYDRETKLLTAWTGKKRLGRLSDKKAQIQQADHTAPKQPHRSEVSL